MKTHLNTLYVTTQGAYLARERESVLVRVEKETRLRAPIHMLEAVVCFGRVGISPGLMGLCGERGVGVSFLTENGKFLARVVGATSGNVLLRREQYRRADDLMLAAEVARSCVTAKVANCRAALLRAARSHTDADATKALRDAAARHSRFFDEIDTAGDLESVRGTEGMAARAYFDVFDHMILSQREDFRFTGRSRRPPLDNINCLLSFVYMLLVNDVATACETVGLDPAVGFLHRDRPGRPSLALDLMEELRPVLADRLVLSLVNTRQLHGKGFTTTETKAVRMDDSTRKIVLTAYQKRKQEKITHPFLDEKITFGLVALLQARLMARFLRGDLDGYPPFVWR